jgi:hypothetical protein
MPVATQKFRIKKRRGQAHAGKELDTLIKALQAFRSALIDEAEAKRVAPTPRNWWQVQSGRFRDDSTFADFVAQVRAARKREG